MGIYLQKKEYKYVYFFYMLQHMKKRTYFTKYFTIYNTSPFMNTHMLLLIGNVNEYCHGNSGKQHRCAPIGQLVTMGTPVYTKL